MRHQQTLLSAPNVRWEPLPERTRWEWPGGKRLAVSFLFHVEFLPLTPISSNHTVPVSAVHRGPYPRHIDVHEVTPHEYGNRVGLFRLMRMLDERGFTASAAIDSVIAENYPTIMSVIRERNWSVLGHGRSGAELQTELVPEAEEREIIRVNLDLLQNAFQREIRGWAGVEYSESTRTIDLLRQAGVQYLCGRPNDEQPYVMTNGFTCLPVAIHLDDIFAGRMRKVSATEHADAIVRAIDVMVSEPDFGPRHLVIGIHPWYSGQPFRAKQLRRVLDRIEHDPRIQVTDTDSMFDHYRETRELSK